MMTPQRSLPVLRFFLGGWQWQVANHHFPLHMDRGFVDRLSPLVIFLPGGLHGPLVQHRPDVTTPRNMEPGTEKKLCHPLVSSITYSTLLYYVFPATTLQSMMNAKLSKQRFWHCHENRLIKAIQTIPPRPIGECQVSFPLLRIRINQDKPG